MGVLCLILFLLPLVTQNAGYVKHHNPSEAEMNLNPEVNDELPEPDLENEPDSDWEENDIFGDSASPDLKSDGVAVVGEFISKGYFVAENKSHSPNITFTSDGNAEIVLSAVKADKNMDKETAAEKLVELADQEGEPIESLNITLNSNYRITPFTNDTKTVLAEKVLSMVFPHFSINNNKIESDEITKNNNHIRLNEQRTLANSNSGDSPVNTPDLSVFNEPPPNELPVTNDNEKIVLPKPDDEILTNENSELDKDKILNEALNDETPISDNGAALTEPLSNVIPVESNGDLNDNLPEINPLPEETLNNETPISESSDALNQTLTDVIPGLENNESLGDTSPELIPLPEETLNNGTPILESGNASNQIPIPEETLNETLNDINIQNDLISKLDSDGTLNDTLNEIIPFIESDQPVNETLNNLISELEGNGNSSDTIIAIIPPIEDDGSLNETLNNIMPSLENEDDVNKAFDEIVSVLANETMVAMIPLPLSDVANGNLSELISELETDEILNNTLVIPLLEEANETMIAVIPLPESDTLNVEELNETLINLVPLIQNSTLNKLPEATEDENSLHETVFNMVSLINNNGTLNETALEMIPKLLDSERTVNVVDQLVQFLAKSNETERVSDILSIMDQLVQMSTNGSLEEIPITSVAELENAMNPEVPIVERFVDIVKLITDMTDESVNESGNSVEEQVPIIKGILESLKKLTSLYASLLTPEDVEKIFETLIKLHSFLIKLPNEVIQTNPDLGEALKIIDETLLIIGKSAEITATGQDTNDQSLMNEQNILLPNEESNTTETEINNSNSSNNSDVNHFLFSSEMILKNMREVLSTVDEVLKNIQVSFDNPNAINLLYENGVPDGVRKALLGVEYIKNSTQNLEIFANSLNNDQIKNSMNDILTSLKLGSDVVSSVVNKVDDVVKNIQNYNKEQMADLSSQIKQMNELTINVLGELESLKNQSTNEEPQKNTNLKHLSHAKQTGDSNLLENIKLLETAINSNIEVLANPVVLENFQGALRALKFIQSAKRSQVSYSEFIELIKETDRALNFAASGLDDPDILIPIKRINLLLKKAYNDDNSSSEEDEESDSEEDSSETDNKIFVQFETKNDYEVKNTYNVKIDISTESISNVMPDSFDEILISQQSVGKLDHKVLGNIQKDTPWSLIVVSSIETLEPGLFDDVIGLQTLEVTYNSQLNKILEGVFTDTNIEILKLQHNKISKIASAAFDNMQQLRMVDLTGNKLKVYNRNWFKNCPNLEVLTLTSNNINRLSSFAFINLDLSHVQAINLDNNNIQSISTSIFSKQTSGMKLNKFTLAHNKVQCIANFAKILQPAVVDLSDNLINCACGMEITEWQKDHPEKEVILNYTPC